MPEESMTQSPEATPGADQAGPAEAPPSPAPSPEQLQHERDDYYDLLLRTRAEFDNYRKRVDRERAEMSETATADLVRALLPIVDDLERALSAAADAPDAGSYRQGVELIHRQLLDVLRQRGVTPIEAVGSDFDPHLHQAVTHELVPGRRDGEVIEEYRRGYRLGSRLLRPSMVKVAAGS